MNSIERTRTTPSERYLGERGADYAAHHHSDIESITWDIEFAYFQPYLKKSDSVLDFGCATGGLLKRLSACVATAHGLEVNPGSRRFAQTSGFTVFGALDEIPRGQLYDVVMSNHVLEHVRDVCGTLEELRSLLKPGGLFVTKLPIDDIRDRHQRTWSAEDKDWHLHTWTPRLFANVLHEAGYRVLEVSIITSAWHRLLLCFRRIGLDALLFRMFAILRARRQLFAVGQNRRAEETGMKSLDSQPV